MKNKTKKQNNIYDFGYFGEWSKETIIKQLESNENAAQPSKILKYIEDKYELKVQELKKTIKKLGYKWVIFSSIGDIEEDLREFRFFCDKLKIIEKDYNNYLYEMYKLCK